MKVTFDEPKSDEPSKATDDDSEAKADADADKPESGGKDSPPAAQWCPACEIKVPLGYITCPKCKSRLPGARMARPASGTAMVAGARRPMWLLLVLAVAGAGAIYYHLLAESETGGGAHRRARAARAAPAAAPGDGGVPEVATADEDAGPPATEEDREQALTELTDALDAAGFEATAEPLAGEPSIVVLRSDTCGAEELHDVLREAEPSLSAGDFHGVRCFSPSGLLSYENTW